MTGQHIIQGETSGINGNIYCMAEACEASPAQVTLNTADRLRQRLKPNEHEDHNKRKLDRGWGLAATTSRSACQRDRSHHKS
eukprot:626123-Amphidinium_carterae.2